MKADSLLKSNEVDRLLIYENGILGTQPGLSYEHFESLFTAKEETFPDHEKKTIPSSLQLAKIECNAQSRYINSLKFTMNDGSESSLLGNKSFEPNKSFSLPADIKIAKLKSRFYENENIQGFYYLTQFELINQNGGLIWKCGEE